MEEDEMAALVPHLVLQLLQEVLDYDQLAQDRGNALPAKG
jgi:hypothetical protein